MAKKIYYGVYQRGKLVEYTEPGKGGWKMPMILLSKKAAETLAANRRKALKKPNVVKAITI